MIWEWKSIWTFALRIWSNPLLAAEINTMFPVSVDQSSPVDRLWKCGSGHFLNSSTQYCLTTWCVSLHGVHFYPACWTANLLEILSFPARQSTVVVNKKSWICKHLCIICLTGLALCTWMKSWSQLLLMYAEIRQFLKWYINPSFTHSHVIPNLYVFFLLWRIFFFFFFGSL